MQVNYVTPLHTIKYPKLKQNKQTCLIKLHAANCSGWGCTVCWVEVVWISFVTLEIQMVWRQKKKTHEGFWELVQTPQCRNQRKIKEKQGTCQHLRLLVKQVCFHIVSDYSQFTATFWHTKTTFCLCGKLLLTSATPQYKKMRLQRAERKMQHALISTAALCIDLWVMSVYTRLPLL